MSGSWRSVVSSSFAVSISHMCILLSIYDESVGLVSHREDTLFYLLLIWFIGCSKEM